MRILPIIAEKTGVNADDILVCENGDCMVAIAYAGQRGTDNYVGAVWIETANGPEHVWHFDDLHAPRILTEGSPLQQGYDSEAALCHMAQSAVSFADYFTSGAGGETEPEPWNRYGSTYANACGGAWDEDGPVFHTVDGEWM